MKDKHDIIADIKRVQAEVGRRPTRRDYREHGQIPDRQIRNAFGGFSNALKAAGITPNQDKKTKIVHKSVTEIVYRDTPNDGTLLRYIDRCNIGIFGDLHFPFVDRQKLKDAIRLFARKKIAVAVQIGDLHDMFSHGKYPRSRNTYSPNSEISLAYEMACEFWSEVKKQCGDIQLFQLLGNHDVRPLKRILELYPEGEIFLDEAFNKWFMFDGVETLTSDKQELFLIDRKRSDPLGQLCFMHGYSSRPGFHRDYNVCNTILGHTHTGGTWFRNTRFGQMFELNAGYLADVSSKALSYRSQKLSKSTTGVGLIEEWAPSFIPL